MHGFEGVGGGQFCDWQGWEMEMLCAVDIYAHAMQRPHVGYLEQRHSTSFLAFTFSHDLAITTMSLPGAWRSNQKEASWVTTVLFLLATQPSRKRRLCARSHEQERGVCSRLKFA